jgi:hypothetical protein
MLTGLLVLFAATWVKADSIVIDGDMYDDVVVREGPSQYYVQIPGDGRTISAPKADVKPEDVVVIKDKAAREALLEEWRKNSALRPKPKAREKKGVKSPQRRLLPVRQPDGEPGDEYSPTHGPAPADVVEHVRSAAGGAIVETSVSIDDKGVKRLVVKGNREKDEGFEGRVEQQRAFGRAQRAAEEEAALMEEVALMEEQGEFVPPPYDEDAP